MPKTAAYDVIAAYTPCPARGYNRDEGITSGGIHECTDCGKDRDLR